MAVRVLWGNISSAGTIDSGGGGYTVSGSSGKYTIAFNPNFTVAPSVVACPRSLGSQKFANIAVTSISNSQCVVTTTQGNSGKIAATPFSFQVMGT